MPKSYTLLHYILSRLKDLGYIRGTNGNYEYLEDSYTQLTLF